MATQVSATRIVGFFRAFHCRALVMNMRLERAALRVQCAWRKRQGGFAAHLLKVGREMERKERALAASRIQSRIRGKNARERAAKELHERRNRAALRVQCRWRCRQGGLAMHLKRQAHVQIERENREAALRIQGFFRGYALIMRVRNRRLVSP